MKLQQFVQLTASVINQWVDWQNMKLNSCDDGWTHFSCKIISWLQLLRCEDLLLFLWMIWIMWMCFNNVELWTVGWTQQALWRCHFGLWLIVTPFLTIFTIVTKQTINGSMEKIISRWIQNENNHQLQSDTKQFKMSSNSKILLFHEWWGIII